ncbi:MAG: transcriptional regulator [Ferrimonas sp.]
MLIRKETLVPFADGWQQPTGKEIQAVLNAAELSGDAAAKLLGISSSRQVRRWTAYCPEQAALAKQEKRALGTAAAIPYCAWAILVEQAGLGRIWGKGSDTL